MRFFDQRFHQAFPSYSGISWLDGKLGTTLLNIMLRPPLVDSRKDEGLPGTRYFKPMLWTRGNADFNIDETFQEGGKIIINGYEFEISRMALSMGRTRYENFIYIETFASPPTGLYNESLKDIELSKYGYTVEEFGYRMSDEKIISRTEYSNNGYVTENGLESAEDFDLRIRHTSPYNFLITHSTSHFHSSETRNIVENFLDLALSKKIDTGDLESFILAVNEADPKQRES